MNGYDSYRSVMSYKTYSNWKVRVYADKSWFDEYRTKTGLMWRGRINEYYDGQTNLSQLAWQDHVEKQGSHWTQFDKNGWQMAPGNIKKWKNTIQKSVHDLMRQDEYNVKLNLAPKDDCDDDGSSHSSCCSYDLDTTGVDETGW